MTFLNKTKIKDILEDIPDNSILFIDGSESSFIDYDVLEMIDEFKVKAKDQKIELHLIEVENK